MDNARAGEPVPNIPEMGRFFPAMDAALEAITNGRRARARRSTAPPPACW
jgi:maltose/maltodextrin transport system substrate-binding protein